MSKIMNYEKRERIVFPKIVRTLEIDQYEMSPIGSFAKWDVRYKRGDEWFAANIKVFKHKSTEPFDFSCWNKHWTENMIGGHPVKRDVLSSLYRHMLNERVEDIDDRCGVTTSFMNYYRPTIIFIFSDGIALEWNIDELPIAWCPISNEFLPKYFQWALNPKTQEDPTLVEQPFYGLDHKLAKIWFLKPEPWRGRNEDITSKNNFLDEKYLH